MIRYLPIAVTICLIFKCMALSPRIVGGRKAFLGEFPMAAQIMHNPSAKHACGGIVLTTKIVMSAAHTFNCDDWVTCATKFRVLVGDVHRTGGKDISPKTRQLRYLKSVTAHENYDPETKNNDIVLLELDRIIEFSKNVAAPTLASIKPSVGTECQVAGWGRTSYTGGPSLVLLATSIKIYEDKICEARFKNSYRPENGICAGDKAGKKSTCKGDSGGPLVCDGSVVAGMISYGDDCNRINVFVDISAYRHWINEKIKDITLRNGCMRLSSTIPSLTFVIFAFHFKIF